MATTKTFKVFVQKKTAITINAASKDAAMAMLAQSPALLEIAEETCNDQPIQITDVCEYHD